MHNKLTKGLTNNAQSDKEKLSEESKKIKSAEKKANALIVTNIFIYLVCRLPELFATVYFFIQEILFSTPSLCYLNIIWYLISNTIEYIYMLSYLFNILIYFKFNTNFKKGFRNFFKKRNRARFAILSPFDWPFDWPTIRWPILEAVATTKGTEWARPPEPV